MQWRSFPVSAARTTIMAIQACTAAGRSGEVQGPRGTCDAAALGELGSVINWLKVAATPPPGYSALVRASHLALRARIQPACWIATVLRRSMSFASLPAASAQPLATAAGTDLVDITRDNFNETFPLVERALKECSFYSFDCEMTGLFLDGNKDEFLDDMQDR